MAFISNHLPLAHSSLQPNYLCNKLPLHSSPCVLVCFWLQFWNKSSYQSFSMYLCYHVIQHHQCERAKKALSTCAQLFLKTCYLLGDWKWTFKSPFRGKIFRNSVSVSYVLFWKLIILSTLFDIILNIVCPMLRTHLCFSPLLLLCSVQSPLKKQTLYTMLTTSLIRHVLAIFWAISQLWKW